MSSISRSGQIASGGAVKEISGAFVWEPRALGSGSDVPAYDKLQSSLVSGSLRVTRENRDTEAESESFISYKPFPSQQPLDIGEDLESSFRWMSVSLDADSEAEVIEDKPDANVRAATANYFLPSWVLVSYDSAQKKARELAESICSGGSFLSRRRVESELISPTAAKVVSDWIVDRGQNAIPISDEGVPAIELSENLQSFRRRGLLSSRVDATTSDLVELQSRLEAAILDELPPSRDTDIEIPRSISVANEFILSYLRTGIRYLGPLRDEPRPVYPLEALENTTDVGYRGEHTAAVLYLHGDTDVRYVSPSDLEAGRAQFGRYAKLREAVAEWLRYMGVATDVQADDAGVFGNQLQVTTEGLSKRHDLTNVGVGVSQVLPIVVSALLAPSTSLLIFEQPELHLHPRVQARLADFFYSVALSGKQCILESHSEYMVDRFRRRIAEEDSGALQKMLSIYFTEREAGHTICTPVNVTRYGAILDWPKDFFEQSQSETRRILEAASKKRKRESQKN